MRHILPDAEYHVLNRGNNRSTLFHKPADYQAFLCVLIEGLTCFRVELLDWCFMPNHWHLVLRPLAPGQLQKFMAWVTITHVRRHHQHHAHQHHSRRTGHLYQGRYKHFPVADGHHFLVLCRYVQANALRAGLVKRAQDWPWSSLYQRLKRATVPPLGDWPVKRPINWLALVNRELPPKELKAMRLCIQRDRPFGPTEWTTKIAARLGLTQTLRPLGRPPRPIESLSPRQRRRRRAENGQNGA